MKCCEIIPGKLTRKIAINAQVTAPDGQGGVTVTWSNVANPYACIKPTSGNEKLHSDRLNAEGLATVIIRYRTNIDERMKVTYQGRDYQIRSIVDIEEMHEWLELVIERGVAQ